MPTPDLKREKARLEQELRIQRQIAFASSLFQGDFTIRTLLGSLAEGVVIIDNCGTILLVNARAEQMFGYPSEELVGKPHAMLIPERFRKVHEEHEAGYFKEPRIRPMGQLLELAGRRRDGSEFPLEISLSFIETINGVLVLAFVSDITLRKQAEEKIAELNAVLAARAADLEMQKKQLLEINQRLEVEIAERIQTQRTLKALNVDLERSNKDLDLFASVASHDLLEPLHTITSYTELLAHKYKDRLDEKADTYIDYIVDGTSHMHLLINDLLAFSRVGTKAKPFGQVKMDSALDQALNSLRKSIEESNAAIEREDLPKVVGDETQLADLFQNLIGNAIKFRKKEARLHIRVSVERTGDEWLFGVHDNGIGIEPRFFDRIFGVFQRLHNREEYGGSGIGLAICRKIVEHHGGVIRVESKLGEGSSFYFTMPVKGESHGA